MTREIDSVLETINITSKTHVNKTSEDNIKQKKTSNEMSTTKSNKMSSNYKMFSKMSNRFLFQFPDH